MGAPANRNAVDALISGASQAAIEHHYDVGSDFYRLWLDARMVYSCALWEAELDDDLDAAQVAKLSWHASQATLDGADRVLDIGCGWGAMLRYATEERNVGQAIGLTLSSDQAASINSSIKRTPAVTVRLEDWRNHQAPPGSYDAIVSIGAFEHFARPELDPEQRRAVYGQFFSTCAEWLPPGGRLSLQTIAYDDFDQATGSISSFFTDEIFPESSLPRLSDIVMSSEPYFRLEAYRSDAAHYEHTLHLWQRRLEDHREAASTAAGPATYRRYLRFLRVSRAMFDRRVCTLYRLGFQRRSRPIGVPARLAST